jgi:hypothetical protein
MQFANHKTAISPFAGELIAQQTSICRENLFVKNTGTF